MMSSRYDAFKISSVMGCWGNNDKRHIRFLLSGCDTLTEPPEGYQSVVGLLNHRRRLRWCDAGEAEVCIMNKATKEFWVKRPGLVLSIRV